MEKAIKRVTFTKSKTGSTHNKISLNLRHLSAMGITPENPEITYTFNPEGPSIILSCEKPSSSVAPPDEPGQSVAVAGAADFQDAFNLAVASCVEILQNELRRGIDPHGNSYNSDVILHSKLNQVSSALLKLQKGVAIAKAVDEETVLSKLDDVMARLNKGFKGRSKSE